MATKRPRNDQEEERNATDDGASDPLPQPQILPVVDTPLPSAEGGEAGNGNGDDDDEEDVGTLLEMLSQDQLVAVLRFSAVICHETAAEIRRVANLNPARRRLIVCGLRWGNTDDDLRAAFSSYGDIEDCRVFYDKETGRCKNYGFVLFRDRSAARRAFRDPGKIDGRTTSCWLASSGPFCDASGYLDCHQRRNSKPSAGSTVQHRSKILARDVHSNGDGNGYGLLKSFSQFEEIEEGPKGSDRHTHKPKHPGANKVVEEPNKTFESHQPICLRATEDKVKRQRVAAATVPHKAPSNTGAINEAPYGASAPLMALAQEAAMLGQGLLGKVPQQAFEQDMQLNFPAFGQRMQSYAAAFRQSLQPNAAVLAMLASVQNPLSSWITLAAMNRAFAAAVTQTTYVHNIGTGTGDFRGAQGFQRTSGNLEPPGYQAPTGNQGLPDLMEPPGVQGPPGPGIQPADQQGPPGIQPADQQGPPGTQPADQQRALGNGMPRTHT